MERVFFVAFRFAFAGFYIFLFVFFTVRRNAANTPLTPLAFRLARRAAKDAGRCGAALHALDDAL